MMCWRLAGTLLFVLSCVAAARAQQPDPPAPDLPQTLARDDQGRATIRAVRVTTQMHVDGKLDGAPSTWIAGIARATAGVGMLSKPRVGTAAYLQGFAPKVDFRDCAQVVQTDQRVCVPVHCYHHVLVTEEWAPLEPDGGHQLKYYAPGVGNIKVGAIGGTNPEVLQLSQLTRLNDKELAAVRGQVLAQDRRGYRVSPNVYGRTPVAQCADCS